MKKEWRIKGRNGKDLVFEIDPDLQVAISWDELVKYQKQVWKEQKMNHSDKEKLILRGEDHSIMYIMSLCYPIKNKI